MQSINLNSTYQTSMKSATAPAKGRDGVAFSMDDVTMHSVWLKCLRPAVTFFRLRPSDTFAPVRPLLKRRQLGYGWAFAIFKPVTGSAGLTAPSGHRSVLNDFWRLHAADAASRGRLRTARPPKSRCVGIT